MGKVEPADRSVAVLSSGRRPIGANLSEMIQGTTLDVSEIAGMKRTWQPIASRLKTAMEVRAPRGTTPIPSIPLRADTVWKGEK